MRRVLLTLVLLRLGALYLMAAQVPGHPLTLPEALEMLRKQSPLLSSARAHLEAVEASEITAGLRPNPVFTSNNEDFNIFNFSRFSPATTQEFTENFSQLIERGRKRYFRQQSARWSSMVAQSGYRDLDRQLEFVLKSSFIAMLLAKSNLELTRNNLHDYQETVRLNEIRLKAGEISPTELDRIRIEQARFENDFLNAQLSLDQARVQLENLLALRDSPQNFDIEGKLEAPEVLLPLEELQQAALAHRPDYRGARDGVSKAQADVRLAEANGATDFVLGTEYKRNAIDNTVGLTFSIPLRIFDRNQGEKARTRRELEASQSNEVAVRNLVLAEVAQAYQAYRTALSRAQLYSQEYLQRAKQVRDRTEFSYRHGGSTLLDYLDAVRSYRDVELAWRSAYAQVMTALHQLSFVTGTEYWP